MSQSESEITPYPSLEVMRQAHRDLQRQFRGLKDQTPMLTAVASFVAQGVLTGAIIEDEEDRWSAQGILDYWSAILYRHELSSIDATLHDYDEALAPEFADDMCPYIGLGTFGSGEKGQFHGRSAIIKKALGRIRETGFLGVLGPAGSGKSSLLRAGVIPALQNGEIDGSDEWHYLPIIAPGKEPLLSLARLLTQSDAEANMTRRAMQKDKRALQIALDKVVPEGQRGVLILDEFEELFYRCDDMAERQAVNANLVHLVGKEDRQHVVMLAMLSTYERIVAKYVADMPALYELFQTGIVRITPPTSTELRDVIVRPAAEIGLRFEEDLVDRLLQDVSGEQTALPLLQFTLLRLWDKRKRNVITWDAYHQVGGGRDALVETAADLYEEMSKEEAILGRNIFLKLAHPNEGLSVELMPATEDELMALPGNKTRLTAVLDKLVDSRLVRRTVELSTQEMQYELVHEALAQDWVQLVSWLDDERFNKRQRIRLRTAAMAWRDNRSPDLLLRGAFLEEAETFKELSDLEQEYIEISRYEYDAATQEEVRKAKEREELALQLAASQSDSLVKQKANYQRLRGAAIVLGAMVLVALLMSWIAWQSTVTAESANAALLVANDEAVAETNARATSEALAIVARENAEVSAEEAAVSAQEAVVAKATAVAALTEAEQSAEQAEAALAAEVIARAEAELNELLAKASNIGSQALSLQARQIDLSLLLSLEALNLVEDINTKNVLLSGLQRSSRKTGLKREIQFTNHRDSLFVATYRPDGAVIASGGYDNDFLLWDAATGEPLSRRVREHENRVRTVAFSPDGNWLVTGGYDNQVMVWDVESPSNPKQTFVSRAHTAPVNTAVFAPNGNIMVTGSQAGDFVIWEVRPEGQLRRLATPIAHQGPVYQVAFTNDSRRLLTVGEDGNVILWDVSRPGFPSQVTTLSDAHSTAVNTITLNETNELFATGDDAGRIVIWSLATLEPLQVIFAHTNWVFDLAFAPNSALIASASRDNSIVLWDIETGSRAAGPYLDHDDWVRDVEFSPDGSHLLSAGRDGTAIVWALTQNQQLNRDIAAVPEGLQDFVVIENNNGANRAVAVSDGAIYRLDNGLGEDGAWTEIGSVPLRSDLLDSAAVQLSPNGRWLAEPLTDTVRLWSLADLDPAVSDVTPITLTGHVAPIRGVTFSADGRYLAAVACAHPLELASVESVANSADGAPVEGDDALVTGVLDELPCTESMVIIWDMMTGEPLRDPLFLADSDLTSLVFSADGTYLATGGCARVAAPAGDSGESVEAIVEEDVTDIKDLCAEGLVAVWPDALDVSAEMAPIMLAPEPVTINGHGDFVSLMTFSPTADQLATASEDGTVLFWDMGTGQLVNTLTQAHTGQVTQLRYDATGELFVSAGSDTRLLVWDLASYQPLPTPLFVHEDSVADFFFVGDGQMVLSAGVNGQVTRSRAGLASWQALACETVNRNMTASEWAQYIGTAYHLTCAELPSGE